MRKIPKEIQRFSLSPNEEHDSCGIISFIEKENIPTKKNIDNTINALIKMNHRAGFINEEGDGVGIHMDIPRALWKKKLNETNIDPKLVDSPTFVVGHFFIEKNHAFAKAQQTIRDLFELRGLTLIFESSKETQSKALGPIAKKAEPLFWQIALLTKDNFSGPSLTSTLFDLKLQCEENLSVHVASLSHENVVYKAMGAGDILPKYYKDLADPTVASATTLGHNRYSTNTLSSFFRVQPFSIIGHNGEINTIAKLRDEAQMVAVTLVEGGSDSQDLDRVLDTFISKHNLSLFEAMEILFPPIRSEIKHFPKHLKELYSYIREAWGHFAQGPAGVVSRAGNEAVFSVDSLGLRPLWMLETTKSYVFSSEQGIFTTAEYVSEPKPLAPGEKVALKRNSQGSIDILWHNQLQEEIYKGMAKKLPITGASERLNVKWKLYPSTSTVKPQQIFNTSAYTANGWNREHVQLIKLMAEKGQESIRSLGYDAPLAALDLGRRNLPDFIKESVAVVTNPAIDREREMEHFSTAAVIGRRRDLFENKELKTLIQLDSPVITEGISGQALQAELEYLSFEGLLNYYQKNNELETLKMVRFEHEEVAEAIERLITEATVAIQGGKSLLVLDDQGTNEGNNYWLDPHLSISALDLALKTSQLRREGSLVLRSGSIRSLHDIAVAIGLGADLVNPYLMFQLAATDATTPTVNLYTTLIKGLEKIISTMGIHELRGYGRLFSAIGLNHEVAEKLNIVNYFASNNISYKSLKEDSIARKEDFHRENAKASPTFHSLPQIWKSIGELASGNIKYKHFGDI